MSNCKSCHSAAVSLRQKGKRKGESRVDQWKRKYGLTVEQYADLFEKQAGLCKICNRTAIGSHLLSVDHCHRTGRVRGLLCNSCNSGMGRFRDDPDLLDRAAEYLRQGD